MKMKRMMLLVLALVMLSPVRTFAATQMQSDEVDRFDVEYTHHGKIETDEDGFITLDQDDYWKDYIIAFKPKVNYARRNSDSLTMMVDVTTASLMTTVQVSTDRNFPKGKTKTYTFTNKHCNGTVMATKHWIEKEVTYKNGNVRHSAYVDRTIYQGKYKITYRKIPTTNIWVDLPITQTIVDMVRPYVKHERKIVIPNIKRGTEYYVKLKNVYEGNVKDRVYSGTVLKVVRK